MFPNKYRSYHTTVLMNVPYTMVHFPVYEKAKQFLGHAHGLGADADLDHLEESTSTHLLAGGSAGMFIISSRKE
jgi:solute carrier family 25 iron transporter 28/37